MRKEGRKQKVHVYAQIFPSVFARDSNHRPRVWLAHALPTELLGKFLVDNEFVKKSAVAFGRSRML